MKLIVLEPLGLGNNEEMKGNVILISKDRFQLSSVDEGEMGESLNI